MINATQNWFLTFKFESVMNLLWITWLSKIIFFIDFFWRRTTEEERGTRVPVGVTQGCAAEWSCVCCRFDLFSRLSFPCIKLRNPCTNYLLFYYIIVTFYCFKIWNRYLDSWLIPNDHEHVRGCVQQVWGSSHGSSQFHFPSDKNWKLCPNFENSKSKVGTLTSP